MLTLLLLFLNELTACQVLCWVQGQIPAWETQSHNPALQTWLSFGSAPCLTHLSAGWLRARLSGPSLSFLSCLSSLSCLMSLYLVLLSLM